MVGRDHYKQTPHVTVGVARLRTLTAQWPWVSGQNLKPFPCNGDVSIWVKNSQVGRKTPNKQTKKQKQLLYPFIEKC